MKVLITGGAGFIGSHLAERLLDDGTAVTVLDDLSTGARDNLAHLSGRTGFELHVGDVRDLPALDGLVKESDFVVHLAAAVGVRLIVERPVHTIETNVEGTQAVLEACGRRHVPVLIASTSEVYGKSTRIPFCEDDDLVLGPTRHSRWAYACSKALDEWLALAFARERNQSVIITRLFNTVGPRQTARYGMVLPNFASQALRGQPITVYGTGDQSRCFAHVRDVVEALVRLMRTSAAFGEVFNVGADREVSMNELAAVVRRIAESSSPIIHIPYDEAYGQGFEDMQRRVPDVGKLERVIGYRPGTSLEDIVADVVTDQRAKLAKASPTGRV